MVSCRAARICAICSILVALCPAAGAQSLLSQLGADVAQIVTRCRPSVVTVYDDRPITMIALERARPIQPGVAPAQPAGATQPAAPRPPGPARRPALPAPPKSGTGFCIGDGYVLTSADVLEGMTNPVIVTDQGVRVKARTLGIDSVLNVGLLQLQGKVNLPALRLGDSSTLAVGNFTISIGNQNGEHNSASLNLVGGIRNNGAFSGGHFYPALIQVAGTIGAGTSGAPLLDADGDVVGIVVAVPGDHYFPQNLFAGLGPRPGATGGRDESRARSGRTGGAVPPRPGPPAGAGGDRDTSTTVTVRPLPGTPGAPPQNGVFSFFALPVSSAGFAVPINSLKGTIADLRSGKPIKRGWIGVIPREQAKEDWHNGVLDAARRVLVIGVFPGSPAYTSGIEPGDAFVSINGVIITTSSQVRALSVSLRPGAEVPATVLRAGRNVSMTLRITERPRRLVHRPVFQPYPFQP
ncbi:MAG: trypsin-like peptidase domain-containing protein [Armatimonadetes bacterium]|nr:trypsin-like peptidase domain-containing protein [Armatimonadota bacterium]MDE2207386.1 trypsin-like peptidase domain-containing protein [Armatimonadota bacterium]